MRTAVITTALGLLAGHAAGSDELAALALADAATPQATADAVASGQLELARDSRQRSYSHLQLRLDGALGGAWRGVLADRLDLQRSPGDETLHNTLQEAYLSWQPQPEWALDLGRIKQRGGVALGFNPLDVWRDAGLRATASAAPGSARDQRQGVVMLRAQRLWPGGSLSALYAPRLAAAANPAPWSLDLGASNGRERWQVLYSQQLAPGLAPQWLLAGGQGQSPQAGVALSLLAGDALTLYGEASGGRSHSLLTEAGRPAPRHWHGAWQLGGRYTTAAKLTLTLEYQQQGRAADRDDWRALAQQPLLGRYRQLAAAQQLAATRRQLFLHADWPDFTLPKLDLSVMVRHDLLDRSQLHWTEARYHLAGADLALSWLHSRGDAASHYAAGLPRRQWQLALRHYF